MPVIAVVNQKGGTGKTTISTTLDCAFAEHFQVLLLDADGQGSALVLQRRFLRQGDFREQFEPDNEMR